MASCTFFGHRNTPSKIAPVLYSLLIDLIEDKNVVDFYVGNEGNFDHLVKRTLKNLKKTHPNIRYTIVLAYMPGKREAYQDDQDTIYPDGLEKSPPKYAIINRNMWMINRSDYVVVYVDRIFGGAANFKQRSEKKGKIVFNLADYLE